MDDHNSPEAIAKRASQEDPIVMYLIMRESLGMSMGKACAQSGHAAQMMLMEYMRKSEVANTELLLIGQTELHKEAHRKLLDKIDMFDNWLDSSFRKVSLVADDKEWAQVKAELPAEDIVIVEDCGLTEIPAGSETFIAVWPMLKSKRPRILKRLQALK